MTTTTALNNLAVLRNDALQEQEKRHRNKTLMAPEPAAAADATTTAPAEPLEQEQWEYGMPPQELTALRELMVKIDKAKGKADAGDLAALRKSLIKYPAICAKMGDQASQVRRRLIKDVYKLDPIGNEMLHAEVENLRQALGYKDSPALEQVCIDQIVNAYLFHYGQENHFAGALGGAGLSLDQGKFWEYRLTSSQKRLLRAIEMLARVRKLTGQAAPGALQINIAAGQQLNLAK
jgi:hypothetical protein